MAKYVLFDLDGTLTDPALGITNSLLYMLEKTGRELPPREELYSFIGPPLVPSFKSVYGMNDGEAAVALKLYREYFSTKGIFENSPYPGIADALSRIKKAGKTVGLATSKPEEFAEKILVHFGLRTYFDCVAGASMDEKKSTKAEIVGDALERLHASPSDTVMVGDRLHDVEGAAQHGVPTVGVLWGYGSKQELETAGAKQTVATMEELVNAVTKEA